MKKHYSRAPTIKEIQKQLEKGIVYFYMPISAFERMSVKARKLLDEKGGKVVIENARGRAIELSPALIAEIVELHKDARTYRQIEEITGVPKSTCHYLIKYAERQKLKQGKETIYL